MPFKNSGQQSIKTPMLEAKPVHPAGKTKVAIAGVEMQRQSELPLCQI